MWYQDQIDPFVLSSSQKNIGPNTSKNLSRSVDPRGVDPGLP